MAGGASIVRIDGQLRPGVAALGYQQLSMRYGQGAWRGNTSGRDIAPRKADKDQA